METNPKAGAGFSLKKKLRDLLGLTPLVQPPPRYVLLWRALRVVGSLTIAGTALLALAHRVRFVEDGDPLMTFLGRCFFTGVGMRAMGMFGELVAPPPRKKGERLVWEGPLPRGKRVVLGAAALLGAFLIGTVVRAEVQFARFPKATANVSLDRSKGHRRHRRVLEHRQLEHRPNAGAIGASFDFEVDGRAVEAEIGLSAAIHNLDDGERVIAYDPDDPTHIELGTPWLFVGVLSIVEGVLLLMSWLAINSHLHLHRDEPAARIALDDGR